MTFPNCQDESLLSTSILNLENQLSFCNIISGSLLPTRASVLSAGWDLYACEDVIVASDQTASKIETGIGVIIPKGYFGRICGRSGLSCKGLIVINGVVDIDYDGSLKVMCYNISNRINHIRRGDRIAQLVIEKCSYGDGIAISPELFFKYKKLRSEEHKGFGSSSSNSKDWIRCKTLTE